MTWTHVWAPGPFTSTSPFPSHLLLLHTDRPVSEEAKPCQQFCAWPRGAEVAAKAEAVSFWHLPVGQLALQESGEEVEAINDSVTGWFQACKGQAGGEEVHDAAQLVAHLK